jgi:hypothetical protein
MGRHPWYPEGSGRLGPPGNQPQLGQVEGRRPWLTPYFSVGAWISMALVFLPMAL